MPVCPKCALVNFGSGKFCKRCGSPLEVTKDMKEPTKESSAGAILLLIGIIGLLYSLFFMETSIDGINNVGLLNQKQNYVIVSSILIPIGIIQSSIKNFLTSKNEGPIFSDSGAESEAKECPECAEKVKIRAKKCRFCGHLFS